MFLTGKRVNLLFLVPIPLLKMRIYIKQTGGVSRL